MNVLVWVLVFGLGGGGCCLGLVFQGGDKIIHIRSGNIEISGAVTVLTRTVRDAPVRQRPLAQ